MKIKSVDNTRFRNNEHFQFHTEVKDLVTAEGAAKLKIDTQFATYLACYNNEDEAFQKIAKSATTEAIESADKRRDQTFRGVADAVKSALRHFDPAVCDAAKRLKIVLDTYGNVAAMPLNEETSAIYNLVQELTGASAAHVQKLGIAPWITELESNNKAFDALVKSRNDETASKTELRMKSCRKELDTVYATIVHRLDALITIEGEGNYEPFVRKLNAYVDRYNLTIAQRTKAPQPPKGE